MAFETRLSVSAVDRRKLGIVHTESDDMLANVTRLGVLDGVLRWRFTLGIFGRFAEINLARFRDLLMIEQLCKEVLARFFEYIVSGYGADTVSGGWSLMKMSL